MRPYGVRGRLVLASAAALAVALVLVAVAVAVVFSAGLVRELDASTRLQAQVLADLVATDQVPQPLPLPEGSPLLAQVLAADGSVLASSASASRLQPLPRPGRADPVDDEQGGYAGTPLRVRARPAVLAGAPVTVVVAAPLADLRRVQRALRLVLLLVVPVLVALGAALTAVVAGRALRPVERLRVAAGRAAAQLDRAPAAPPPVLPGTAAPDEAGRLAATLQELVDGLHGRAAQQRALVADAAHELRSPLAGLAVQLDVARAHPATVTVPELVDELAPDVDRLDRLVADLLALARLDAPALAREPLDLRELAGAQGEPVTVLGDRAALARLVDNLRSNASRAGRTVVVRTSAQGTDAVLDVDDDGPGIPPADRERVLERFVRLDDARTRSAGGSGLGLAIVRQTARAHGGDVEVLDSPLGGARLRVRLPRAPGFPAEPGGKDLDARAPDPSRTDSAT